MVDAIHHSMDTIVEEVPRAVRLNRRLFTCPQVQLANHQRQNRPLGHWRVRQPQPPSKLGEPGFRKNHLLPGHATVVETDGGVLVCQSDTRPQQCRDKNALHGAS